MKSPFYIYLLPLAFLAHPIEAKPDYFAYNEDGSIKIHGVYETSDDDRVTKYTVYDGEGKLIYTEIPYYSENGTGALIRADRIDKNGKLLQVGVPIGESMIVLNAEGNVVDKQWLGGIED